MNQEKSLSEVHESVHIPERRNWWRTLLAFAGPAYMVSVGYMDPGNWATDIAGGSSFGYRLIWVLLMSNLIALLLQSLAARLGIVKGWDLAQASRQQFPAWANISQYILAEIAIAACDLAEIIGMAIGLKLLFGLPMIYGVLITILDTFLLLFLINKGIRKLELFILGLVSIIGLSFITEMFIVKPDIASVVKGFVPGNLDGTALYIAIGIIGATVMPHNLYLHSSLVQTRKFSKDTAGIKRAIRFNFFDSLIALNLAFFVNAAILVLAASAFYTQGFTRVNDIGDAHILLQSLFGNLAPTIFAIALICAGQSSTITGTLAGQIVMEGYLRLRISPWMRRLLTRLIAVVPAAVTILYYGEDKLGALLVFSQVVLSLQLGFAVIPLIHFTGSKRLMGQFAIKPGIKILAWVAASVIVGLNIKLVYESVSEFTVGLEPDMWWLKGLIYAVVAFSLALLLYIIVYPFIALRPREKQLVPHGDAIRLDSLKAPVYERVAITVDFSRNDLATIQHALALGGKSAHYLLIHVVESAGALRLGKDVMDTETLRDIENIKAYKTNLAEMGFSADYQLGFGHRAADISDIVKQNKIDILVMGAHGHKGLKDLIFGSTVDTVRHMVSIPVLVVRG